MTTLHAYLLAKARPRGFTGPLFHLPMLPTQAEAPKAPGSRGGKGHVRIITRGPREGQMAFMYGDDPVGHAEAVLPSPAPASDAAYEQVVHKVEVPPAVEEALERGADLVISVSGGKDSDAMTRLLLDLRARRGWSGRVALIHADLGRAEWDMTPAYMQEMAARYGVELHIVRRPKGDLIQRIEQNKATDPSRIAWPSSTARFCTSEMKRDQIDKWLKEWAPSGEVVCAVGLRHEESAARSKTPGCMNRARVTTLSRSALTWHPLIHLSKEDVWTALGTDASRLAALQEHVRAARRAGATIPDLLAMIRAAGWPAHPVYALGNQRLSCALCILGSQNDIANAAEYQPDTYRRYVDIEIETGDDFKHNDPLYRVRPDVLTDEQRRALRAQGRL